MQCSKINTHSRKCMILLECLTHHLVPESSPTPSHLPKPRMRIIILFVCGQPSDVCISIRPSPTIDIIYGLPSDVYQLGRLRRLIFLVCTTLRSFLVLRQPSEPFSLDSPHALTPIVLGCSPKIYCISDSLLQTLTLAYIRLRAREITKTKLKLKAITRVEMRKTKNGVICTQKHK